MKESVREHSEEEFMGKYVDSDREDRPAKQGLKQKRRRANAIKMNVSGRVSMAIRRHAIPRCQVCRQEIAQVATVVLAHWRP